MPWLPVYLQRLGFSETDMAVIGSIPPLCLLITPILVSWLQSLIPGRSRLIYCVMMSGCFLFSLGISSQSSIVTVICLSGLFFCRGPGNPLLDSLSLGFIGPQFNYGKVRLYGSLGFVAGSLAGGYLLDFGSVAPFVAAVSLSCFLATAAGSVLQEKVITASERDETTTRVNFRDLRLWYLLVVICSMNLSHGPYFTYYSLYLERDCGLQASYIGWFWAISVVAEMVVMSNYHRWFQSLQSQTVLAICLTAACVRWTVTGLSNSFAILLVVQMLHALTYGAFHLAIMDFIRLNYNYEQGKTLVHLYASIGFGLCMMLGAALSGTLIQYVTLKQLFLLFAIIPPAGLLSGYALRSKMNSPRKTVA